LRTGYSRINDLEQNPDSNILPAIRIAPLGELRLWIISEQELNEAEQGSPSSLYLNFAVALLGSGLSFLTTLLVTDITSIKTFTVFVVMTVIFLVIGAILFAIWYRLHRTTKSLAQRIRDRMPPPPGLPVA
jgi:uncharacterized membrane protein YqjE